MTYRFILSDISETLKQNIANRKFSNAQILFWILCIADRLKSQHISKLDSGAFIHHYVQLPISTEPLTGRKYIELPSGIYDYDLDEGVRFLSYDYTIDSCTPPFTSVTFSRTSAATSKRLYWTEEEKPTPSNPYFYRLGDKLFLLGTECITIINVEAGLNSNFDPDMMYNSNFSLDDEFYFPQELIQILKMQLFQMAQFGLAIPQSRTNTGNYDLDNTLEQVPKQKMVSVNDQQDNSQQQQQ